MDFSSVEFWLVIAGFLIAFILAFGIGANDVANTFGTSVGAKVLTLQQACVLATIFETLGSILIGAKVSGTIRKGIIDPQVFEGNEMELMIGYISALLGCCIWLFVATFLSLPISGTHSIVGSTIGMALVSKGFSVIKWIEILKIVASWIISPVASGLVSALMFFIVKKCILTRSSPLNAGIKVLPLIYTMTIFINFGGILESAPPLLGLDKVPFWGKLIMLAGVSIVVYFLIWLVVAPFLRKQIENAPIEDAPEKPQNNFDSASAFSTESAFDAYNISKKFGKFNSSFEMPIEHKSKNDGSLLKSNLYNLQHTDQYKKFNLPVALEKPSIIHIPIRQEAIDLSKSDPPETKRLFSYLQILTAIFGSFAHGGNDVSNAVGPLVGLFLVYKEGKVLTKSSTPEWILLYGGVGISIGLWVLGRRVIKTVGEDLTKITPSSGFVIELASSLVVLAASLLNIPVSSTHCKVGSVVFTGRVRSKESVDWSLFRNIGMAWILTLPITCGLAALCQLLLKLAFGIPL